MELHDALPPCFMQRQRQPVRGEEMFNICCFQLLLLEMRWICHMCIFNSAKLAINHSGVLFLSFKNCYCPCCKK